MVLKHKIPIPAASDLHFEIDHYLNKIIPPTLVHRLPRPISYFLGHRETPKPDVGNILIAFWALVGAFCGLTVVGAAFRYSPWIQEHHPPVLIASLGAAAVLEFNAVAAPMGQPRNAVLGHILSAFVGIGVAKCFEYTPFHVEYRWLAGPLACGIASATMTLTNTIHPPGGATAILAASDPTVYALGWMFLPLVFLACLLMLGVALVVNNIQRRYPIWWWTPQETGTIWKRRPEHGVMDIERFNDSTAHTLAGSPNAGNAVNGTALEDTIVLSSDGLMSIPRVIKLDDRERAVLERLLAKLQASQLGRQLTEKSWTEHPHTLS